MARDAIARLYDVDEDSVGFKRLEKLEKYDQGTITFRARQGHLIDLDKLHESIWATRLSGGTHSGLVSLDVTAIGEVVETDGGVLLKVSGSDEQLALRANPAEEYATVFAELIAAAAGASKVVRVSGRVDDYVGRWPDVLRKQPVKPRRILVTSFQVVE